MSSASFGYNQQQQQQQQAMMSPRSSQASFMPQSSQQYHMASTSQSHQNGSSLEQLEKVSLSVPFSASYSVLQLLLISVSLSYRWLFQWANKDHPYHNLPSII